MPSISLGTVYRNLQILLSQNLLIESKIGRKPARYETRHHRHYHITCTVCGALEDVAVPYQQELDRKVAREMSCRLQEHRMEFLGVCPGCQKKQRNRLPARKSAAANS